MLIKVRKLFAPPQKRTSWVEDTNAPGGYKKVAIEKKPIPGHSASIGRKSVGNMTPTQRAVLKEDAVKSKSDLDQKMREQIEESEKNTQKNFIPTKKSQSTGAETIANRVSKQAQKRNSAPELRQGTQHFNEDVKQSQYRPVSAPSAALAGNIKPTPPPRAKRSNSESAIPTSARDPNTIEIIEKTPTVQQVVQMRPKKRQAPQPPTQRPVSDQGPQQRNPISKPPKAQSLPPETSTAKIAVLKLSFENRQELKKIGSKYSNKTVAEIQAKTAEYETKIANTVSVEDRLNNMQSVDQILLSDKKKQRGTKRSYDKAFNSQKLAKQVRVNSGILGGEIETSELNRLIATNLDKQRYGENPNVNVILAQELLAEKKEKFTQRYEDISDYYSQEIKRTDDEIGRINDEIKKITDPKQKEDLAKLSKRMSLHKMLISKEQLLQKEQLTNQIKYYVEGEIGEKSPFLKEFEANKLHLKVKKVKEFVPEQREQIERLEQDLIRSQQNLRNVERNAGARFNQIGKQINENLQKMTEAKNTLKENKYTIFDSKQKKKEKKLNRTDVVQKINNLKSENKKLRIERGTGIYGDTIAKKEFIESARKNAEKHVETSEALLKTGCKIALYGNLRQKDKLFDQKQELSNDLVELEQKMQSQAIPRLSQQDPQNRTAELVSQYNQQQRFSYTLSFEAQTELENNPQFQAGKDYDGRSSVNSGYSGDYDLSFGSDSQSVDSSDFDLESLSDVNTGSKESDQSNSISNDNGRNNLANKHQRRGSKDSGVSVSGR